MLRSLRSQLRLFQSLPVSGRLRRLGWRGEATYPSKDIKDIDLTLWDIVGRSHELKEKSWHLDALGVGGARPQPPVQQDQLQPRKMRDSFCEGYVRLGQDLTVRTSFMNFLGGVRVARLLESMDVMAGYAAYLHCQTHDSKTNPVGIVTALVDRIDIHKKIQVDKDIRLSAFVSWVGKSSMEVAIVLDQESAGEEGTWTHLADATFVMVARSGWTDKAQAVNGLVLTSDEREHTVFKRGDESRIRRQLMAQEALTRKPPTEEERLVIHNLFLQTIGDDTGPNIEQYNKPDSAKWMTETRMNSMRICHPQHRNIHNKIFGGYLMRQAFELAWTNACLFCGSNPQFVALDDTWFRCPVEIGSILNFTSQVMYTDPLESGYFQVSVTAEVIHPVTQARTTTNVFHYTFRSKDGAPVPLVFPKSYAGAMRYLHGSRCFKRAMLRVQGSSSGDENVVHSLLASWRELWKGTVMKRGFSSHKLVVVPYHQNIA